LPFHQSAFPDTTQIIDTSVYIVAEVAAMIAASAKGI
jgi:hypothetical protein